ncbi:MAG: Nif11-like leader peptide family RiPP precursor [Cyanobacteriota bacterium]|nr:Nif11-like leader peptide family RiPP precursor [Cyanobacteriota bacterium]
MLRRAMSKSQLNAFMVKVDADSALRARVDAAASVDAVVAIALEQGHVFSPASWTRSQRG